MCRTDQDPSSSSSPYFSILRYSPLIIAVMIAWRLVVTANDRKYLWLRLPTQVPTHGQWWSWTSMHALQSLQWKLRGGLNTLQVLHLATGTSCPSTKATHSSSSLLALERTSFSLERSLEIEPSRFFGVTPNDCCDWSFLLAFGMIPGSVIVVIIRDQRLRIRVTG